MNSDKSNKRAVIGSDHAGIAGRKRAAEVLAAHGFTVVELGPEEGESADYPDLAHQVASQVESGEATRGVLVCGTGQGMAMAANRHVGVRAAVITDAFTAEMARGWVRRLAFLWRHTVFSPNKGSDDSAHLRFRAACPLYVLTGS